MKIKNELLEELKYSKQMQHPKKIKSYKQQMTKAKLIKRIFFDIKERAGYEGDCGLSFTSIFAVIAFNL